VGEVTLSTGAVLAVTGLLGSLVSAIGILFYQLIASKNSQISREQQLTNELLPAVKESNRTLQRLVELIQAMEQRASFSRREPSS
jgi:hypothetical protein